MAEGTKNRLSRDEQQVIRGRIDRLINEAEGAPGGSVQARRGPDGWALIVALALVLAGVALALAFVGPSSSLTVGGLVVTGSGVALVSAGVALICGLAAILVDLMRRRS